MNLTSVLYAACWLRATALYCCRSPVERECLEGWANTALAYFWAAAWP
jgi:hypothetical protein